MVHLDFEMAKKRFRETEMNARSERVSCIREEMAMLVRFIGGGSDVIAERANFIAARITGLPITTIRSLRWRKIKRVPADVADAVRDAAARVEAQHEKAASHEIEILRARLEAELAVAANLAVGAHDASLPSLRQDGQAAR